MSIDKFRGEYNFLSNFYPCRIEYDGRVYSSVEAAYQACKTDDPIVKDQFVQYDARQAKQAGKELKPNATWNDIKYGIMVSLLLIKFNDPTLKAKLLYTRDEELIEGNNWHDVWWGVCEGNGKNMLGKALMYVRAYYRDFE